MEENACNNLVSTPDRDDEMIYTPLTDTLLRLKEQAMETNLLYVMDVEALLKLAALNQLQQHADRLDEYAPEQRALYWPFKHHYNWLVSAGSDAHGPDWKPITYRAALCQRLLERLGIQVQ